MDSKPKSESVTYIIALISVAAKGLKTIVSTDHPDTLERLEKVAAG